LWGAILGTVVVQYLTSLLGEVGATYTTIVLGGILVMMVLLFPRGLAPALIKGIAQILRLCSPMGAGG
jgi:branched-chain amino acid transport system permease protein